MTALSFINARHMNRVSQTANSQSVSRPNKTLPKKVIKVREKIFFPQNLSEGYFSPVSLKYILLLQPFPINLLSLINDESIAKNIKNILVL